MQMRAGNGNLVGAPRIAAVGDAVVCLDLLQYHSQSVLVLQSMSVLQFVPEKLQLSRSAEQPAYQGGGHGGDRI